MTPHPAAVGVAAERPVAVAVVGGDDLATVLAERLRAGGLGVTRPVAPGPPGEGALAGCWIVLVVAGNDEEALSVCLRPGGVLGTADADAVLLLAGDLGAEPVQRIGAAAARRGLRVLSLVLAGGVRRARSGDLVALVGGDAGVLAAVRPTIDLCCAGVHHLGALRAPSATRSITTLLRWTEVAAAVEAIELARRLDVDLVALQDVLAAVGVGGGTVRDLREMRLTRHEQQLQDVRALAGRHGVPLPMGEAAQTVLRSAGHARLRRLTTDDEEQP